MANGFPTSPVLRAAGLGPRAASDVRRIQLWVRVALSLCCLFLPLVDPRPDELALEAWENEGGPPAP